MWTTARIVIGGLVLVVLAGLFSSIAEAQKKKADFKAVTPEVLKKWGQAETVVTAKLVRVIPGPVGRSFPPLWTFQLQLNVKSVLRGSSIKPGTVITGRIAIRQKGRPVFPEGKEFLASLSNVRAGWRVNVAKVANAAEVAQIRLACSLPLGWSMTGMNLVSPWAALGPKAWPGKGEGLACSVTGRPPLLAGGSIQFTVEKVPPKKKIRFRNPDGDGEYKITVANTTKKPVAVPALLSDGNKILWEESVVLICQNKSYPCPDAKGVNGKTQPTVLKPGQSVSAEVNILKVKGPRWPRGGSRIEFRFCLGEKSVTQSFYYFSRHHDEFRGKAQR